MRCSLSADQRKRWLAFVIALVLWALLGVVAWWVAAFYWQESAISATWACSTRHNANEECHSDGFLLAGYILYLCSIFLLACYATCVWAGYDLSATGAFVIFLLCFCAFAVWSWITILVYYSRVDDFKYPAPEHSLQWLPYILFVLVSALVGVGLLVALCVLCMYFCANARWASLCGNGRNNDGVQEPAAEAAVVVSVVGVERDLAAASHAHHVIVVEDANPPPPPFAVASVASKAVIGNLNDMAAVNNNDQSLPPPPPYQEVAAAE